MSGIVSSDKLLRNSTLASCKRTDPDESQIQPMGLMYNFNIFSGFGNEMHGQTQHAH
jgi:hypothetical protein